MVLLSHSIPKELKGSRGTTLEIPFLVCLRVGILGVV